MKTQKTTIRMPEDLIAYVSAKAKASDRSFSAVVVDMIKTHRRVEQKVATEKEQAKPSMWARFHRRMRGTQQ